jgi:hypothetical protein
MGQVLPNLIVIGAGRAGTTSLHHYLGEHPDIFVAREKELMFFVEEMNWGRGIGWYERHFPEPAPVRGEASPQYTLYPLYKGVPQRMASLVPDARLIYLVRDPMERLFSQYALNHSMGYDGRSLAEALAAPERSIYVDAGRYWTQLSRYLDHFPRESILVLDAADLEHRRADVLRSVFGFVGVDSDFVSTSFASVHNMAPERQARAAFRRLSRGVQAGFGYTRYRRVLAKTPKTLRPFFTSAPERPAIEAGVREELEALYREETAHLREFTGLPFSGWSV